MKTIEIIEKALTEKIISEMDISIVALGCGLFSVENINDLKKCHEVHQNNILKGLREMFANPKF
jgi:hypothetical protein